MRVGDEAKVAGWTVTLKNVRPVAGDNWVALEGEVIARNGSFSTTMAPQARQFFQPSQQTSEAALLTRWNGQLYVVLAPVDGDNFDRWQVRLWWKPFVTLIWFGAGIIAFGGFLALIGRMRLFRRRQKADETWGYA